MMGRHERWRESLEQALAAAPRAGLVELPTPVHALPRLASQLGGPQLFVKRDDLTGLTFGGNKSRMFEYILPQLMARGVDTIVAGAMIQSNYCRQMAGACARLGLDCHLLLRPVKGLDQELQANLLLDHLAGATVEVLPEGTGWDGQMEAIEFRARELERRGRKVGIPQHHKLFGALAYAGCALELEAAWRSWDSPPAALVVTSGETTQAGLLIGLAAAGLEVEVVGVTPSPGDATGAVRRLAAELAGWLGHPEIMEELQVENTEAFAGQALALPPEDALNAVRLLMRLEGLPLDPIYTGRGMAALLDGIHAGRWANDEAVVFLHTGGLPLLFLYPEVLGES